MNTENFLRKASDNLKASRICLEHKLAEASINRSYYACAQMMAWFLARHEELPQKANHDSIRNKFLLRWREYYGIVDSEFEKIPLNLFEMRYQADYSNQRCSVREAMDAKNLSEGFYNFVKQKERAP